MAITLSNSDDIHLEALSELDASEVHPEEQFILASMADAEKKLKLETHSTHNDAYAELVVDLPDQGKKSSQQVLYAQEKLHRKEMARLANEAALNASVSYALNHPQARHLACTPNSIIKQATPRNKVDLNRYYISVIDCLIYHYQTCVTMQSVLIFVNKDFPHAPQNANIWTRKLPKFQIDRIANHIKYSTFNIPLKLGKCKSLRDIREVIQCARATEAGMYTARLQVVLTSKQLLVNGVGYAITEVKSAGKVYPSVRVKTGDKRSWIRVDTLIELLELKPSVTQLSNTTPKF